MAARGRVTGSVSRQDRIGHTCRSRRRRQQAAFGRAVALYQIRACRSRRRRRQQTGDIPLPPTALRRIERRIRPLHASASAPCGQEPDRGRTQCFDLHFSVLSARALSRSSTVADISF